MNGAALLVDAFGRVREAVDDATAGLTVEQLAFRPDREANSIAWLVWHLTRVQDSHLAEVAGHEQTWVSAGWARRFALPFDDAATGYGQGSDDVAAVRASAELLRGYHDAVHARTSRYVEQLGEQDLERIVDATFDPPVSLGVRLVSVIGDSLQHAGQAGYIRGLVERND